MDRILLINPPYEAVGVKESVSSVSVTLSLAMLAAVAREHHRAVSILDLNLHNDWEAVLRARVLTNKPGLVGITFATPLVGVVNRIAKLVKETLGGEVLLVGGGPHATALPLETLRDTAFDALAVGEAESSFAALLMRGKVGLDEGWWFKDGGKIAPTGARPLIRNLDELPMPAFDLFAAQKYVYPSELSRANPVCLLETSRGCYGRCCFCNKNIFGSTIRRKSPKRVVDEIQSILAAGFKEIHLADDLFTADARHATAVCDEVLARKLRFWWVPRSGIRVDSVSRDLLVLMKRAGCYHIPFGIESGSQPVLDAIGKRITVTQVRSAVALAKELDLETTGYFMFGLPAETRAALQETLDLAFSLPLDHIKFGTTVPLPGTALFSTWASESRLLQKANWEKYTYSTPPWELYQHPNLSRADFEEMKVGDTPLLELANTTIHRSRRDRREQ